MIQSLVLLFVGFLTLSVQAEVYQCNFTEQFIIVTVDTDKKVATWQVPGEATDPKDVELGPVFVDKEELEAPLTVKGAQYILDIDFRVKGSDGMSDFIYPYAGQLRSDRDLYGGCFTENNKPVCPRNGGC